MTGLELVMLIILVLAGNILQIIVGLYLGEQL